MATALEWRVAEFNAQELANTAWAFATATHRDDKLFAAVAKVADRRLSEFNAQELANAPWVLATMKQAS